MKLKLLPSISPHSLALCDFNSSSVLRHKHSNNFIVASKSKKHRHNEAQGSDSQSSPPRITSNAKQNLRFLKSLKEYQQRKSRTPKPATSYRKKKAEKKPIPDDEDHDTSSLYQTNQFDITDDDVPVLLVDGYNVCGYWVELKEYFLSGRLELARQKLIDELKTFSMTREVKVVVVFDAMMSGFPNHKEYAAGIEVVFSSETSADTWIEKEVSALKENGCSTVWVATSDRCQQESANGAVCIFS